MWYALQPKLKEWKNLSLTLHVHTRPRLYARNLAENTLDACLMWAGLVCLRYTDFYQKDAFDNYYTTSLDALKFKRRGQTQSKKARKSHTHLQSTPYVRRLSGMRRYFYRLLSTSTIKVLLGIKTFLLYLLPMLFIVMNLDSGQIFISLSKCLCYQYNMLACVYISVYFMYSRWMHYQDCAKEQVYTKHYFKVWINVCIVYIGTIRLSWKHEKDYTVLCNTYWTIMEHKDKKTILHVHLLYIQQIYGRVLVSLFHHCSMVI